MRHKRLIISIIVIALMLTLVFAILLPAVYEEKGSDRVILHFLREIPLEAQKYTLDGESENWKVRCVRYDGIILSLFEGKKKLLQDITLTLNYTGAAVSQTEGVPVTFSMKVDSMFTDHLRQVYGEDVLTTNPEAATIWYSAGSYPKKAPANQLPQKDAELSIEITVDGKTEVVTLRMLKTVT